MANSFNMNVTARPGNGLVLQGGFNSARTDRDSCALRDALPENDSTDPWCNTSTGFGTRITALGSYMIPKIDVQVSGTFSNDAMVGITSTLWMLLSSMAHFR